jgi:hypothetical protein
LSDLNTTEGVNEVKQNDQIQHTKHTVSDSSYDADNSDSEYELANSERIKKQYVKSKPNAKVFYATCYSLQDIQNAKTNMNEIDKKDKWMADILPLQINSDETPSDNYQSMSETEETTATNNSSNSELDDDLFSQICAAQRQDIQLIPIFDFYEKGLLQEDERLAKRMLLQIENYVISDNALYHIAHPVGKTKEVKDFSKQLVIPDKYQMQILKRMHDSHSHANHGGFTRTYALIRDRFFWNNMCKQTFQFVKTCKICHTRKRANIPGKANLLSQEVTAPLRRISLDLIGPLPQSKQGSIYILVITCAFTHYPCAYALPDSKSLTIATALVEFFCTFGIVQELHSDCAACLMSQVIRDVCTIFGVHKRLSASFHPRGQGGVEKTNASLINSIAMQVQNEPQNWQDMLPFALFSYRIAPHAGTGFSPFFALFGFQPLLPIDIECGSQEKGTRDNNIYFQTLAKYRRETRKMALENTKQYQQQMKNRYNANSRPIEYKINDTVYLHFPYKAKKFSHLWRGPYSIKLITPNNTVRLMDMESGKILKNLVHVDRIKFAYLRPVSDIQVSDQIGDQIGDQNAEQNELHSSSMESDTLSEESAEQSKHSSEEEFSVEKILKCRKRNGKTEYLCKWINCPNSQNSYVKYEDLNAVAQEFVNNNNIPIIGTSGRPRKNFIHSLLRKDAKIQVMSCDWNDI